MMRVSKVTKLIIHSVWEKTSMQKGRNNIELHKYKQIFKIQKTHNKFKQVEKWNKKFIGKSRMAENKKSSRSQ